MLLCEHLLPVNNALPIPRRHHHPSLQHLLIGPELRGEDTVSGQGEVVPSELVGVDFIQRRVGEGTVAGQHVGNGHFRE